ncbi:hypothetical protein, partial [Pseudomonas aeruginosa]|uniref:hypothetical protein n=1 Tax=Pseudomonas aeruginosa TaxID=287 RepID=UPI001968CBB9
ELTFSKILDSFSSRSDFFYTLKCEEPVVVGLPAGGYECSEVRCRDTYDQELQTKQIVFPPDECSAIKQSGNHQENT